MLKPTSGLRKPGSVKKKFGYKNKPCFNSYFKKLMKTCIILSTRHAGEKFDGFFALVGFFFENATYSEIVPFFLEKWKIFCTA